MAGIKSTRQLASADEGGMIKLWCVFTLHPDPVPSERRGNDFKCVKEFYLEAVASIWSCLSFMCPGTDWAAEAPGREGDRIGIFPGCGVWGASSHLPTKGA